MDKRQQKTRQAVFTHLAVCLKELLSHGSGDIFMRYFKEYLEQTSAAFAGREQ